MIARLLRAVTLSAAAFALAWVWLAWQLGTPWLAVLGLVLVMALQAGVLGLEFLFARGVHRADPTPRPSGPQLLHAWLGECSISARVFGWWQPWRSTTQPDQPGLPGRRGIVFVHGYFCNRGVWRPWLARCRASGVPFIAPSLEPAFGSIDDYAPIIDAAVARLEQETGVAPLIVAHSMGGLAVRAWWAATPGAAARVQRVFTIGTPHRGTWLARFGLTRNAMQMRIGSPWMGACDARVDVLSSFAAHCTCVFSHTDNIVFPPSNAVLVGARAIHIAATGHVALADHPEVVSEVESWLGVEASVGAPRD
jgi:triacylglycerol esterase/lipase EstA (alpha/beta hydrolase family)